jgi:hypothetical protein
MSMDVAPLLILSSVDGFIHLPYPTCRISIAFAGMGDWSDRCGTRSVRETSASYRCVGHRCRQFQTSVSGPRSGGKSSEIPDVVNPAKAAIRSRARVGIASRAHDNPSAYVNGQARLVAQRDGVIATVSTFDVAQRGKWCWTDGAVTVPPDPAASRGRARSAAKAGIPRQPRDGAGGRRSTARRTGDFADA